MNYSLSCLGDSRQLFIIWRYILTEKNNEYMRLALSLAVKGAGYVSPNPMVGAVIVKNGKIIGQGYHELYGCLHAERNAFKNCIESPVGADMYVTLEPCCHYGKNPPCTQAIIDKGIKKVFVGSFDPNPLVAGNGIKQLRDNGIEVVENVLRDECDRINEVFFHFITTKKPFVMMKYAMTLDGKIACYTGESKWISSEESRYNTQEDRHKFKAIMVGVGTVIADNPSLTCRIENSVNPVRIICDSNLRIPLNSNIVSTAVDVPTIIATCSNDANKHKILTDKGCKIILTEPKNNRVDLNSLMNILGKDNIDSIILEGGGELNWSALESGIVHKIRVYISPKIFGGKNAKSPVGGKGVCYPSDAFCLEKMSLKNIGEDILVESWVKNVHRYN